jgi:hypothetical protein
MTLNKVMAVITGEFFLKIMPNGGTAVLLRSSFISIYLYLLAIAIKSLTSECATFSFSADELRSEFNSTIPWLGVIFGGTYAALYSRFSSQWSYLADLYNQQLSASLTLSDEQITGVNFAIWQAAFIEDAVCMHLDTKPGFSNAILEMLQEKNIRGILEREKHFGKERVSELVQSLTKAVKK